MSGGKKILISDQRINKIIKQQNLTDIKQNLKEILLNDIYISISKYSDSIMIIINQTNTIGSIYKAKMTGQSLPIIQQDFDELNQNQTQQLPQAQKIYEIKCIFGSTQIQFYDILLRKILQLCYEQNKIDPTTFIMMNISLPVKFKEWDTYQSQYYQQIIKNVMKMLKDVC